MGRHTIRLHGVWEELQDAGYRTDFYALELIAQIEKLQREQAEELDLVRIPSQEGQKLFQDCTYWSEFKARLQELGLGFCPADMVLHLLREFRERQDELQIGEDAESQIHVVIDHLELGEDPDQVWFSLRRKKEAIVISSTHWGWDAPFCDDAGKAMILVRVR